MPRARPPKEAHDMRENPVILREQRKLLGAIERRTALRGTLSLGALTLLTGCDLSDDGAVQSVLDAMSRWNDRVQAALFSKSLLAPTFDESQAVKNFRYNAYFPKSKVPKLAAADYRLELAGMIGDKRPWSVEQLHALPQESQVTRHVCVEGWSMIGKWSGTPLRVFLERIGADTTARYVGYTCADGYYDGIDMPTALHPQTIMAFKLSDEILPVEFGFPFKIRIPTKLGFKNPKWITSLYVTNREPAGFWPDRGYNWFGGL
jgi:DMSO/TMAO reductase YedYZ molybdopterin-dependent catalytic subunit